MRRPNQPVDANSGLNRALTLIELVVVVAVIGILAASLVPAMTRAKHQAQRIHCVSNLHQLGIAVQNFVAANHAFPSIIAGTNSENPGSWMGQLERGGFDVSKPKTNFLAEGVWRCPSARWGKDWPPHTIPACYGYNGFGTGGNHTNALGLHGQFISGSALFAPVGESEIVKPDEMMGIGDSFSGGVFFMRTEFKYRKPFPRHQSTVNVMFCDGHVESPTLKFVFEDTSDTALVRWNRDHQPHRERLTP